MNIITKDTIKNDDRFFIDERNINRLFMDYPIIDYRVKKIKVGLIIRKLYHCERIVTLDKTYVYKYLEGGEQGKQAYEEFKRICNYSPLRSEAIFDNLVNQIAQCDYNIKKGAIVIDQNNLILDGMHRSCILLHKYGANQKIDVVQFKYKYDISTKYLMFKAKIALAKIQAWLLCYKNLMYR